jgi:hypothetical protein
MPIYILQSTCDRVLGAYANNSSGGAGSPSYTLAGCSSGNTLSYSGAPAAGAASNIFGLGGSSFSTSSSCTDPGLSGINFPNIPITTASLNYTIPAGICGASSGTVNYYVSGMINQNIPCFNSIYTPPSSLALTIACPATLLTPGPFCASQGTVQLTTSMPGGTWTVTPYLTSGGVFNPALAGNGTFSVTYTVAPCGPTNFSITVNSAPTINGDINDMLIDVVPCSGVANSNVVGLFNFTGGPGTHWDWDDAGTAGNDVYPEDGYTGSNPQIYPLGAGNYYLIAVDNNGCADTLPFTVFIGALPDVSVSIDNVNCFGGLTGVFGGIHLTFAPSSLYLTYDWSNDGAENPDNDPEDLYNIPAGSYTVTVTFADDPSNPSYTCDTIMTFTVTQPPQLTVTAPNGVALCNGGTTTITATPSGGTPGYTYDWSNDGQENPDNDLASITVGATGSPYTVTVTDSKGCTATAVSTVTQPTAIVANAVGGTFTCNMGVITLTVSGGTPGYTFDWSNDGPENPDNDPQNLSGLGPGIYTVTVTDLNGCTRTSQATITITPPTFTPPANTGSTVPCIFQCTNTTSSTYHH